MNPRPPPCEGGALPAELLPHARKHRRKKAIGNTRPAVKCFTGPPARPLFRMGRAKAARIRNPYGAHNCTKGRAANARNSERHIAARRAAMRFQQHGISSQGDKPVRQQPRYPANAHYHAGINRFCTVFSTRLRGSRFRQFRRCAAPCVHSRAHSAGVHARPAAALPSVRAVSKLRPSAARNLPARAGGSAL